jgi:hypothetical protein
MGRWMILLRGVVYELDEQRKPDRQHQVPNIYLATVLCADNVLTRWCKRCMLSCHILT